MVGSIILIVFACKHKALCNCISFFVFALAQKAFHFTGFSNFYLQRFWTDWQSLFHWNPWLIFCRARNQNWPDPPGQMDLKLENKSLLSIIGESLFLTSMTRENGGNIFCLRKKRQGTLLEVVIKLPVSNF